MTSTTTRPAIDIGPPAGKPELALLLGVLAVPGSTLAWDLPLGGLWIGLPLGIAAIVLGIRARPPRQARAGVRMATVGIALATLSILQMAVWAIASALS